MTLSKSNKEDSEIYFLNTMTLIQSGMSREIALEMLMYYEEQENYIACIGVKKAIEWCDFQKSTSFLLEINEFKNKIEDNER